MIVVIAVDVYAVEHDPGPVLRYRVSALVLGQMVTGVGNTLHVALESAMNEATELAQRTFPDDTLRFTVRSILPA